MTAEPGRDAARHLQNAALELIAALRAALDAAEELVRDPATAAAGAVVTEAVRMAARKGAAPSGRDPDTDAGDTDAGKAGGGDGDGPGVTRIRIR